MHTRCRRGCRCVNCVIASDDFNRADTGDLSPQWLPDSLDSFNSWVISGNKLMTFGTSVGLEFATLDPENPDDDGIRWSAVLNFGGSMGRMALQVDRIDDSNFHWAEVRCTGATAANLRLWRREGGSDTALTDALELTGFSWSTDFDLAVCWGLQYTVPPCSASTREWIWVYDDSIDEFIWVTTGSDEGCDNFYCTSPYPDFDGTFEGQTTFVNCVPVFGSEGQPVFGLSTVVDGSQALSVPAEPLGGLKVAVQMTDAVAASFDNVSLSRFNRNCPRCAPPCLQCTEGEPNQMQVDLEGEYLIEGECGVCNATFLGAFILSYYGSCEWRYYFPGQPCGIDYLRLTITPSLLVVNMIDVNGADQNFWNTPAVAPGQIETPMNCAEFLDRFEVPRGSGEAEICYAGLKNTMDAIRCYVTAL